MKMKNYIYFLISLLSSLIILNCSDTETLVENENELIVVEAFLYEGQPVEEIHLIQTLPLGSEDTVAPPINDAFVKLIKNGNVFNLERNIDDEGFYHYLGSDLVVSSADLFNIEITYADDVITGETSVPIKPQDVRISSDQILFEETDYSNFTRGGGFDSDTNSILITWDNIDSTLYYVVVENIEENPVSIYSDLPFARNQRFISIPAATSEYSMNRRTVTHFGKHQAIVYKVNQEYADLYDTREQDSRNLNEPLTNITNGLGIFSAFASDTVYFNAIEE